MNLKLDSSIFFNCRVVTLSIFSSSFLNIYINSSTVKDGELEEDAEMTESPGSHTSLVPRFTKPGSDEDEDYMPDLCLSNYNTLQVINDKIFVFEEEVSSSHYYFTYLLVQLN